MSWFLVHSLFVLALSIEYLQLFCVIAIFNVFFNLKGEEEERGIGALAEMMDNLDAFVLEPSPLSHWLYPDKSWHDHAKISWRPT